MKRSILLAVIYSALCIAFKMWVFYAEKLETPIGRLSLLITLVMVIPFVVLNIYLAKKANGGVLPGKEAVKQGLTFVTFAAIIMVSFDYIFYVTEMREFYINHYTNTDYHALFKEAVKHKKDITMNQVVRDNLTWISTNFRSFSLYRSIFPYFAIGLFASFVSGALMKRG